MNIGVISLGCAKNLVDSEVMLHLMREAGDCITDDLEQADVIVVNTCAFVEDAKRESIQTILQAAEYKKARCKKLIVTGCMSQRYKEEVKNLIPEVDAILGTGNYKEIVSVIHETSQTHDFTELLRDVDYLNLGRHISTGTVFAYLKIAEGCDNCCAYCVIPSLRGKYISRKQEDILREAKELIAKGIKEIVLVAQDVSYYGMDLYQKLALPELLQALCALDGDFHIRLMYCYPERITDTLIDTIAQNEKILKYIDLPIQHISDNILQGMGRKGNSILIKDRIDALRKNVPNIVLRTTLMVGFPGETEEDFQLLQQFVKTTRFERLGVFTYSKEDGTKAATMRGQIRPHVKQKRMDLLMQLQKNIVQERNQALCGSILDVTVEQVADDGIFYVCRSYAEAPDGIDPVIYVTSEDPLEAGMRVPVEILTHQEYDLIGKTVI